MRDVGYSERNRSEQLVAAYWRGASEAVRGAYARTLTAATPGERIEAVAALEAVESRRLTLLRRAYGRACASRAA